MEFVLELMISDKGLRPRSPDNDTWNNKRLTILGIIRKESKFFGETKGEDKKYARSLTRFIGSSLCSRDSEQC